MRQLFQNNNPSTFSKYILLLHGNSDVEVPHEQSLHLAQKLASCGADVSAVCVDGAGHEWDFWSQAVYDEILGFLNQKLSNSH